MVKRSSVRKKPANEAGGNGKNLKQDNLTHKQTRIVMSVMPMRLAWVKQRFKGAKLCMAAREVNGRWDGSDPNSFVEDETVHRGWLPIEEVDLNPCERIFSWEEITSRAIKHA